MPKVKESVFVGRASRLGLGLTLPKEPLRVTGECGVMRPEMSPRTGCRAVVITSRNDEPGELGGKKGLWLRLESAPWPCGGVRGRESGVVCSWDKGVRGAGT